MCKNNDDSKFNADERGHYYGYSYGGGWDIDTSDRTQRTCDGGHIRGAEQFEETIDVSEEYNRKDDDDDDDTDE